MDEVVPGPMGGATVSPAHAVVRRAKPIEAMRNLRAVMVGEITGGNGLSGQGPGRYSSTPSHGEKTFVAIAGYEGITEAEYRRRIRAWTMYDWANSAFATTILAAVLPVYYSSVAGSTLASESIATAYWTIGLSVALFIVAIISPILGTISDIKRGKKPMLAFFVGMGVVGTGLLVLVGSGDWLLASVFFVIGRIGFGGANVFYDALLPHVAREEDQDRVSSLGLCDRIRRRRDPAGHQRGDDLRPRRDPRIAAGLPQRRHLVGRVHHPPDAPCARTAGGNRGDRGFPGGCCVLPPARHPPPPAPVQGTDQVPHRLPHLQRRHRDDHRRRRHLRGRVGFRNHRVDPGPGPGAVRRHPLHHRLRADSRRRAQAGARLSGLRRS